MSEISGDSGSRRRLWHYVSGGVFLIGLAVLFYVGFWPWILALLGLIAIIEGIGEYHSREVEKKD
ncbi:MAG: hypothetical protein QXS10_03205 [Candidatus Bathyarchaeia archaeon]